MNSELPSGQLFGKFLNSQTSFLGCSMSQDMRVAQGPAGIWEKMSSFLHNYSLCILLCLRWNIWCWLLSNPSCWMDSRCPSLVWEFSCKCLATGRGREDTASLISFNWGSGSQKAAGRDFSCCANSSSPLTSGSILFCSPVFTVKLLALEEGKGRKQVASRFRYFNCRKCLNYRPVWSRQVLFITRCIILPWTLSII